MTMVLNGSIGVGSPKGGADVSGVTATAETVFKDYIFVDSKGTPITGTYEPVDLSGVTATADKVLQDYIFVDSNGEVVTGTYVSNENAIIDGTLSGKYYNGAVDYISPYALYGKTGVTELDFPLVTKIGTNCFAGLTALTSVSMPLLKEASGDSHFKSCTSLESVEFPLLEGVADNMFGGCSNLTNVNLPEATSIGQNAFGQVNNVGTGLEILKIPKVTTIGSSAFYESAIEFLELYNVTSIGAAAFYHSSLGMLTIYGNTVPTLVSADSTFVDTPIANGTGYICVPEDMVAAYKNADGWKKYADRIDTIE